MKKILLFGIPAVLILASLAWWQLGRGDLDKQEVVTSADNAPEGSIHNLPVPDAVAAVRARMAEELGVSQGIVIIMTAYEMNWSDACLGLAGSDEMCAQVITPGYEVTAQAAGEERVYRTNSDGSQIRLQK